MSFLGNKEAEGVEESREADRETGRQEESKKSYSSLSPYACVYLPEHSAVTKHDQSTSVTSAK